MGITRGSRDTILELWDTPCIWGTVEARNSRGNNGENDKLVQWGHEGDMCANIGIMGPPRMSGTAGAITS